MRKIHLSFPNGQFQGNPRTCPCSKRSKRSSAMLCSRWPPPTSGGVMPCCPRCQGRPMWSSACGAQKGRASSSSSSPSGGSSAATTPCKTHEAEQRHYTRRWHHGAVPRAAEHRRAVTGERECHQVPNRAHVRTIGDGPSIEVHGVAREGSGSCAGDSWFVVHYARAIDLTLSQCGSKTNKRRRAPVVRGQDGRQLGLPRDSGHARSDLHV